MVRFFSRKTSGMKKALFAWHVRITHNVEYTVLRDILRGTQNVHPTKKRASEDTAWSRRRIHENKWSYRKSVAHGQRPQKCTRAFCSWVCLVFRLLARKSTPHARTNHEIFQPATA